MLAFQVYVNVRFHSVQYWVKLLPPVKEVVAETPNVKCIITPLNQPNTNKAHVRQEEDVCPFGEPTSTLLETGTFNHVRGTSNSRSNGDIYSQKG